MKKKGFTLMELLAVIVILAVISIITIPAVINIIEDSEKAAAEASAKNIASAAKSYYVQNKMKNNIVNEIDLSDKKFTYDGEQAEKGFIAYDIDGNTYGKMYISGYCINVTIDGTVTSIKQTINDCKLDTKILSFNTGIKGNTLKSKEYEFGQLLGDLPILVNEDYEFLGWYTSTGVKLENTTKIINSMVAYAKWKPLVESGIAYYYNPVTNTKCDSSEAVSMTGIKEGCMKWYSILDDGKSDKITLLLDHNTTAKCAYATRGDFISAGGLSEDWGYGNSNKGPVTANKRLAKDTTTWNENVKSTARLITAEEVAKIVRYKEWDNNVVYFDSSNKELGTNKYAWLFDYTTNCTKYGCNVADSSTYGYWTSTESKYKANPWHVDYSGRLTTDGTGLADSTVRGIRPVITLDRTIVS